MTSLELLIKEVRERPCLWDKKHPLYKNRKKLRSSWLEISRVMKSPVEVLKKKWKNLVDYFRGEVKKNPRLRSGDPSESVAIYKGKWEYFTQMSFMIGSFRSRENKVKVIEEDSENESATSFHIPEVKTERFEEETSNFSDGNSFAETEEMVAKDEFDPDDPTFDHASQVVAISNRYSSTPAPPSPNSDANPSVSGAKIKKEKPLTSFEQQILQMEQTKIDTYRQASRRSQEDRVDDEDLHFFKSLLPYMRKLSGVEKLKVRSRITSIVIDALVSESGPK